MQTRRSRRGAGMATTEANGKATTSRFLPPVSCAVEGPLAQVESATLKEEKTERSGAACAHGLEEKDRIIAREQQPLAMSASGCER